MTYQSAEESVASGKPVELNDIAMGITHWRLTSSGEDITYATHKYTSAPCKRTEIEKTEEVPKDSIEIELPRGHALGLLCLSGVPDEQVTLTVYRGHPPFYVTYFKGFLTYLKFNEKNIAVCTFEPRSSDLPFIGGRRRAMRLCGHLLYGYRCGVNRESYRLSGTIDSISGVTITATEFGAAAVIPDVYGDLTGLAGCLYDESEGVSSRAYDNSSSTYWITGYTFTDNWTRVRWPIAQKIKKIRIKPGIKLSSKLHLTPGDACMKYFRIAGSDNGSLWTTIDANQWIGNCSYYGGEGGSDTKVDPISDPTEWIGVILDNDTAYFYYRIWVYDTHGGTNSLAVQEIEMIEADNVMSAYFFGAGGEIIIGTARRTITAQVGNTITINRPFGPSVVAGASFYAYPGCDHTQNGCVSKYNNILNYGGQTHLPVENPYDSKLYY